QSTSEMTEDQRIQELMREMEDLTLKNEKLKKESKAAVTVQRLKKEELDMLHKLSEKLKFDTYDDEDGAAARFIATIDVLKQDILTYKRGAELKRPEIQEWEDQIEKNTAMKQQSKDSLATWKQHAKKLEDWAARGRVESLDLARQLTQVRDITTRDATRSLMNALPHLIIPQEGEGAEEVEAELKSRILTSIEEELPFFLRIELREMPHMLTQQQRQELQQLQLQRQQGDLQQAPAHNDDLQQEQQE
ncbi:hypothetical protein PFISCL1PPCAC_21265, partial [Pristionchus fissidentatus]